MLFIVSIPNGVIEVAHRREHPKRSRSSCRWRHRSHASKRNMNAKLAESLVAWSANLTFSLWIPRSLVMRCQSSVLYHNVGYFPCVSHSPSVYCISIYCPILNQNLFFTAQVPIVAASSEARLLLFACLGTQLLGCRVSCLCGLTTLWLRLVTQRIYLNETLFTHCRSFYSSICWDLLYIWGTFSRPPCASCPQNSRHISRKRCVRFKRAERKAWLNAKMLTSWKF